MTIETVVAIFCLSLIGFIFSLINLARHIAAVKKNPKLCYFCYKKIEECRRID